MKYGQYGHCSTARLDDPALKDYISQNTISNTLNRFLCTRAKSRCSVNLDLGWCEGILLGFSVFRDVLMNVFLHM